MSQNWLFPLFCYDRVNISRYLLKDGVCKLKVSGIVTSTKWHQVTVDRILVYIVQDDFSYPVSLPLALQPTLWATCPISWLGEKESDGWDSSRIQVTAQIFLSV